MARSERSNYSRRLDRRLHSFDGRSWFDGRSAGRGANQVGELLQHLQMLIAKHTGRAGEHFQNSRNAPSTVGRNDSNSPDAYSLAPLKYK